MSLKSSYEGLIYNLNSKIISFGSFERDGSFPYVYNNEQSAIILEDIDSDFVVSTNNNIQSYKSVNYKGKTYTIPIVKNQIEYTTLDTIAKNNDAKISLIYVSEMYKVINPDIDENGMMVVGYKYDQQDDSFKFKTIGVRATFGVSGSQYGMFVWAEALQYDQDDDGNTTIDSLVSTDKTFIPYDYSVENLTIMSTFEYNSDTDKLYMEYKSVEKDQDGNRLINFDYELNCDDDNAAFDPSLINMCITMPELNQTIEYSLFHIKTFGDKLNLDALEHQSNILITL